MANTRRYRIKRDMADDIRISQQLSPGTGIDTMQLASTSPVEEAPPSTREMSEDDVIRSLGIGKSAEPKTLTETASEAPSPPDVPSSEPPLPGPAVEKPRVKTGAEIKAEEEVGDFLKWKSDIDDIKRKARLDRGAREATEKVAEATPNVAPVDRVEQARELLGGAAGKIKGAGKKAVEWGGERWKYKKIIDYGVRNRVGAGTAADALKIDISKKEVRDLTEDINSELVKEHLRAKRKESKHAGPTMDYIAVNYGGYTGTPSTELQREYNDLIKASESDVVDAETRLSKAEGRHGILREELATYPDRIKEAERRLSRATSEEDKEEAKEKIEELNKKYKAYQDEFDKLDEVIPTLKRNKVQAESRRSYSTSRIKQIRDEQREFREAYAKGLEKYKKEVPTWRMRLYQEGEKFRKLGDENLAMGKMKSVTDVISKPIGSKSQEYWEKMFEKGTPGYRSDRSITDLVTGAGTLREREDTLSAITSLRGSGASKIFTLPQRGTPSSAFTPALTVNVKGIGVGDISAMGIKVRKDGTTLIPGQATVNQPILEKTKVTELDSSYVGQYPGQKSWQKARVRGKEKKLYGIVSVPTLERVRTPSVANRLEMGKASVGIAPDTYSKAMVDQAYNCGIKPIKIGVDKMTFKGYKPKANKGRKKK